MFNLKNLNKAYSHFAEKKNLTCYFMVILIFFFDRISKIKIIENQIEYNSLYINDYLNFDLVWNTGVGFGLFSSNTNLFYNSMTVVIGSVIVFILYWMTKLKFIDKFFFSLVLGGALGNFYDRLTYLAVPDFIDIHYNNFHWFTFNIADIFITIGIILIIIKDIIFKKNEIK